MSLSLSLAGEQDAAEIAAIYAPYVENTTVTFEYEAPSAEEFADRIREIAQFFPFFLLRREGEAIGYAYAHAFHPRKAYQWVCETSIYVRQDCCGQGYAAVLYRELLAALKKQGFCQAMAVLACPNEPSERFHQRQGFALCAELPRVGYKLGRWLDIQYYQLELNPRTERLRDPLPFSAVEDGNYPKIL